MIKKKMMGRCQTLEYSWERKGKRKKVGMPRKENQTIQGEGRI